MKRTLFSLALAAVITALAGPVSAACYADFKAKRDDPLNLLYSVIELPDAACGSKDAAWDEIEKRIRRDGWVLLDVLGIFDRAGAEQRKDRAGDTYLKY